MNRNDHTPLQLHGQEFDEPPSLSHCGENTGADRGTAAAKYRTPYISSALHSPFSTSCQVGKQTAGRESWATGRSRVRPGT